MSQFPKTVTAKMWIHAGKYSEGKVELFPFDISDAGYLLLGTTDITFDVPEFSQADFVAAEIATIEKEKERLVKEYEPRLAQLDERLKNLRSLTYDGAAA